ncbi:MAG: hypothetical protein IRZ33_08795, partial [Alicyclobacillaceae bacterium]|nr:hypothetical protein [Alicyclobacillaceae bacterium]
MDQADRDLRNDTWPPAPEGANRPEAGAEPLWAAMARHLRAGTLPHAILLVGPKERTWPAANRLAQMLVCTGSAKPCGECQDCQRFAAGVHPDVHVFRAEGSSLRVSAVEELQEVIRLRPHKGRTVYVLAGIDRATPVAANRLLKTLEEPSGETVAILTADSTSRVLSTIVSRCFEYRLTGPSDGRLVAGTAATDSAFAAVVEAVIQWTESCLGGLEPPLLLSERLMQIPASGGLPDCLYILASWLRDVLQCRLGNTEAMAFAAYRAVADKQAQLADERQLAAAVELVLEANTRLQAHVVPQVNVDQLCIRLRRVLDVVHSGG